MRRINYLHAAMHTSAGKTENGGKNETPALKSHKNKLYSKKYIKIPQWVPLGVFKTFFFLTFTARN